MVKSEDVGAKSERIIGEVERNVIHLGRCVSEMYLYYKSPKILRRIARSDERADEIREEAEKASSQIEELLTGLHDIITELLESNE